MIRTADIPRGHGTTATIVDLVVDDPDTHRLYGRRMITRWCAECPACRATDQRAARLRRLHTAYRRHH